MDYENTVVGVDVGGTKILAGIAREGKLVAREYMPTLAEAGMKETTGRILAALDKVCRRRGVDKPAAIGIAIAGLIDMERGVVVTSPHLPGWKQVPLAEKVERATGVRTLLINDANAAAVGEHIYGAGRGVDNLIYITVSTGIGGGIILGGELYFGFCGTAGEIGHMVIEAHGPPCDCGSRGCLETLASGSALAREAMERISQREPTSIMELSKGQPITAQTIYRAARLGDRLAQELIEQAATYLGVGLANLVNIFNPQLIIVGGGLSRMGRRLLAPAVREMKARAFALPARKVRVVRARLGADAGVLGAIAFVLKERDS